MTFSHEFAMPSRLVVCIICFAIVFDGFLARLNCGAGGEKCPSFRIRSHLKSESQTASSPFRSLRRRRHRGLCSQGIGGRRRRTRRRSPRAGRRPVPGAGRHRRVSDLDVRGAKVLLRTEERPRLLGHPVEAATTTQCTRSSVERGAGEICHLRKSITSGQL